MAPLGQNICLDIPRHYRPYVNRFKISPQTNSSPPMVRYGTVFGFMVRFVLRPEFLILYNPKVNKSLTLCSSLNLNLSFGARFRFALGRYDCKHITSIVIESLID